MLSIDWEASMFLHTEKDTQHLQGVNEAHTYYILLTYTSQHKSRNQRQCCARGNVVYHFKASYAIKTQNYDWFLLYKHVIDIASQFQPVIYVACETHRALYPERVIQRTHLCNKWIFFQRFQSDIVVRVHQQQSSFHFYQCCKKK